MLKRKPATLSRVEKLQQVSDSVLYQDGRLYCVQTGKLRDTSIQRGYRKVRLYIRKGLVIQARAHRVVWYKHYGAIPEGLLIDHIDGDRGNNCVTNLRLVTHTDNSQNCKGAGFYFNKNTNKFQAYIYIANKPKHLGSYDTAVDARVAYLKAKHKHHPAYSTGQGI